MARKTSTAEHPPPARPTRYIVLGTALAIRDWRVDHSIPEDRVIAGCTAGRLLSLRGRFGDTFVLVTLDSWNDVPNDIRGPLLTELLAIRSCNTVTDYAGSVVHG
jgi:hypothetical protein